MALEMGARYFVYYCRFVWQWAATAGRKIYYLPNEQLTVQPITFHRSALYALYFVNLMV